MAYRLTDFVELAIRRINKGNCVRLIALEATADFYGWSSVFPRLFEAKRVDYPDGRFPHPGRKNLRMFRAQPVVISRSEGNKQGFPVRLTNRFRVTNNVRDLDLFAIAQATQIPFGWMTNRHGKRVSQEKWMEFLLPDAYRHFDRRAGNY